MSFPVENKNNNTTFGDPIQAPDSRPSDSVQSLAAAVILGNETPFGITPEYANEVVSLKPFASMDRAATTDPVQFFTSAKISPDNFDAADIVRIYQMMDGYCFNNTMSFHDLFGLEMNRLLTDLSADLDPTKSSELISEWRCLWLRGFLGLMRITPKEIYPLMTAETRHRFLCPPDYQKAIKDFTLKLRAALLEHQEKRKKFAASQENGAQKVQKLEERFKNHTNALFNRFNATQKMLSTKFLTHPQNAQLLLDTTLNHFPGTHKMLPTDLESAQLALAQLNSYIDLLVTSSAALHQLRLVPGSRYLSLLMEQVNSLNSWEQIDETTIACRKALKAIKAELPSVDKLTTLLLIRLNKQSESPKEIEKATSDYIFHCLTIGWANDCTHSLLSILEQLDGNPTVVNHVKRFALNFQMIIQSRMDELPQLNNERLSDLMIGLHRSYEEFMNNGVIQELHQILHASRGKFNITDTYLDNKERLFKKIEQFINRMSQEFGQLANQFPDICKQEDLLAASKWFAQLCLLRYDLEQMAHPFDRIRGQDEIFPDGYIDFLALDPMAPSARTETNGNLSTQADAAPSLNKKKKKKKKKKVKESAVSIPMRAPSEIHRDSPAMLQSNDHTEPAHDVAEPAYLEPAEIPAPLVFSSPSEQDSADEALASELEPAADLIPSFHVRTPSPAVYADPNVLEIKPPQSRKRRHITEWVTKVLGLAPVSGKKRGKGDHRIFQDEKGQITLSVPSHAELAEGTLHAIEDQYREQRARAEEKAKVAATAAAVVVPDKKKKKRS